MIDGPLLVVLAVSAVSGLAAYAASRRKRKHQVQTEAPLERQSNADLNRLLDQLQPQVPERRQRVTLLIIEEMERRQRASRYADGDGHDV